MEPMSRHFLISLRESYNLSIEKMASAMGLSVQDYSNYEVAPYKMNNQDLMLFFNHFEKISNEADAKRLKVDFLNSIHFDSWNSEKNTSLGSRHLRLVPAIDIYAEVPAKNDSGSA